MDQKTIIKRCQIGDMEAFETLYKNCITKALQTTYLLVNNKSLAEDIVQEAFIECYRDIKYLKHPEAFISWFYKILLRVSWKMVSKERRQKTEKLDSNAIESSEDVSSLVESIHISNVVQKSIEKLNDKLKEVVILHYYNDMSVKEISEIIECFEGTVKSRLYTARKILKRDIESSDLKFEQKSNYLNEKECKTNG